MIGKVIVHAGAEASIKYDTKKNGAEILHKNNLYGENANDWAKEMRAVSDQRNVKNDTFHISFSLDKEYATTDQWNIGIRAALESLGFEIDKTQYLLTRHVDAKHDHVHVVVNRIMLDGSIVSDSNIRHRTHEATRAAELAAGLTKFQKSVEIGKSGKMAELRLTIKNAISESNGYDDFKSNLKHNGIELIENKSVNTGHTSGISYKIEATGQVWKGSAIGKEYSYAAITKALDHALEGAETAHTYTGSSPTRSGGISVGGGSSNLGRNLTSGREGIGLTAGQKDRIRRESSHEL